MNRKEFERISPEAAGVSSKALSAFVDRLQTNGHTDMHGIMMMRHGKVFLEGW